MNAPRTAMLPRFACAATLAAAGCAANPEFRAVGAEQVTATAEATEVHVVVELMNPNDAPVELTEWDYSFTVDDRTAYSGKWMASLTLPPRDRMLALLPAVVPASFGDVSAARWRIGGSVGYRATGQLDRLLYQLGINRLSAGFGVGGSGIPKGKGQGTTAAPKQESPPAPAAPEAKAPEEPAPTVPATP
jgi:hypothetical protein